MSTVETIASVWDGLTNETRRQELSHYRGVGKWADDNRWQSVGRSSLKRLVRLQHWLGRPPLSETADRTVLEWGPGGGSNAYAFRARCKAYYGVDISHKNLIETQRVLAAENVAGVFHPVLLEGAPQSIQSAVDQPVDVFLSTAVFQHFPSPAYGLEVLTTIRALCAPGAIGLIQIRYDNGDDTFRPNASEKDYRKRFVKATSYQIDAFWSACDAAGFTVECVSDINPKVNYASFYLSVPLG